MKNYNKHFVIPVLFLMGLVAQAQHGPGRERIKTLKVAFITERLALTPTEAQDFWPVYNAHEDRLHTIRRRERQQFGSQLPLLNDLSENQTSKLLTDFMALQEERHQVEQDFLNDLKTVLPSKKIVLLLKAEEDFKKRLLQQVRKRRGQ